MLLSLFARPTPLGAIVSIADRTAHAVTRSVVTRRLLFATPQFNFPLAEASRGTTEEATRKSAKKKALKEEKQLKKTVRIPENLRPPKRAPGPFFLFLRSFVNSQHPDGSQQERKELVKRGGEIWNGYSIAEKQPFYDENEARKVQANQEREEFFRNMSLSDLRQLNAIRKAKGKKRVRIHGTRKQPLTPFLLFSKEFRDTPDGHALINETAPEKPYVIRAVIASGVRWKSMSLEEKAPYYERHRKAREEWNAECAD